MECKYLILLAINFIITIFALGRIWRLERIAEEFSPLIKTMISNNEIIVKNNNRIIEIINEIKKDN